MATLLLIEVANGHMSDIAPRAVAPHTPALQSAAEIDIFSPIALN